MDQSRTFFYPEMDQKQFSYDIDCDFSEEMTNLYFNYIYFRRWTFKNDDAKLLILKCAENLRSEKDKSLWEIQVTNDAMNSESYAMSEKRMSNRSRMLEEFQKRQELKENDKWFYSVKETCCLLPNPIPYHDIPKTRVFNGV